MIGTDLAREIGDSWMVVLSPGLPKSHPWSSMKKLGLDRAKETGELLTMDPGAPTMPGLARTRQQPSQEWCAETSRKAHVGGAHRVHFCTHRVNHPTYSQIPRHPPRLQIRCEMVDCRVTVRADFTSGTPRSENPQIRASRWPVACGQEADVSLYRQIWPWCIGPRYHDSVPISVLYSVQPPIYCDERRRDHPGKDLR